MTRSVARFTNATPAALLGRLVRRSVDAPVTMRRSSLLAPALVVVVLALLPAVSGSPFDLSRYELVLIYMMVAIGLNFSFGYAGQLAVAQPVLMGTAAYVAGLLNLDLGWNAWMTLVPAVAASVVVGILVSSPGFRLRGWYLGITTFFAVTVFPDLVSALQRWTGGDDGLGPVSTIPFFGDDAGRQYWFILGLTALCWLGTWAIVYSRWGITLRALRDSPNGARGAGVNLSRVKVLVAAAASVPVGLSGWTFVHQSQFISPKAFGFNLLLLLVAAVLLGGRGTLWGPVIGTVVFEILSLYIGPFSIYNSVILGAGVLVFATLFPHGAIPVVRRWLRHRLTAETDRQARTAHATAAVAQAAVAGSDAEPAPAPEHTGDVVLRARGIRKSFGGFLVLDGVDVELVAGRVHGLVGPNGSGKTTLLNVLTGFVPADSGSIELKGELLERGSADAIARLGIRRSFQVPQLVPELSVAANIALGAVSGGAATAGGGDGESIDARARRIAAELGLAERLLDTPISDLSLGLRRIVEIGRAMIASPAVICLDEPAAGLAQQDLAVLEQTLRRLAGAGHAVLLIEHNLSFVRGVADTMILLEEGRVVSVRDLDHATRAAAPRDEARSAARRAAAPLRAAE